MRVRNHGRATPQVTLVAFTVASPVKENPLAAVSDGNPGTMAKIGAEPVSIALDSPATEVVLLLGEDPGSSLRVMVETAAGRKPLAPASGPLQRFALPAGATGIVLAASRPVAVNEVVFTSR